MNEDYIENMLKQIEGKLNDEEKKVWFLLINETDKLIKEVSKTKNTCYNGEKEE